MQSGWEEGAPAAASRSMQSGWEDDMAAGVAPIIQSGWEDDLAGGVAPVVQTGWEDDVGAGVAPSIQSGWGESGAAGIHRTSQTGWEENVACGVSQSMRTGWEDNWAVGNAGTRGPDRPTRASYVPPHLRHRSSMSQWTGGCGRISWNATTHISSDQANTGIDFDAYKHITVEATGDNVPPPVNSFAQMDLGEAVNENIRRCKYANPTPVQRHAIPVALAGRDLMACAQTGSGKTAAFCFPIIAGVLRYPRLFGNSTRGAGKVSAPRALILSPTRELTLQIHAEARKFAHETRLIVAVVYGGAPLHQQLREMERGVDILVATPGRLVALLERGRVSLAQMRYLALDEADRMLDMGFEPQIRTIVEEMDMPPPGKRQTMLFSATFPKEIQRLAADFLSSYIFLSVGRVGSSTDLITQDVQFVFNKDKRSVLMELIRAQGFNGAQEKLLLVFVQTKRGADSLQDWLRRIGIPAISIHGDRSQQEREHALQSFRSGKTPILVATDVAARGLDVPNVAHVINFDLPNDIDDYVHRIGRTGRAGKKGLATAFFTEDNVSLARPLVELMQESNQEVPAWLVDYAVKPNFEGSGTRNVKFGKSRDYRYEGGTHLPRNDRQFGRFGSDKLSSRGAFYGDPQRGSQIGRVGTNLNTPWD